MVQYVVPNGLDRLRTCPFLLRVFWSIGSHINMSCYNGDELPVEEVHVHTWMDATLEEITVLVSERLGFPMGSRFDLRAVYATDGSQEYRSRDLGTTVRGLPGPSDVCTLGILEFKIGQYMDMRVTLPPPRISPQKLNNSPVKKINTFKHYKKFSGNSSRYGSTTTRPSRPSRPYFSKGLMQYLISLIKDKTFNNVPQRCGGRFLSNWTRGYPNNLAFVA